MQLEPKTFCGVSQRKWASDDLCVDLSKYAAGCAFPRHGHRDAFFCYVLEGACEEYAGGRQEVLRAGSLIYHPPGFEHSNRWHQDGRCMHIEFGASLAEGVGSSLLGEQLIRTGESRAVGVVRQVYQELAQLDAVSGLAFEGLTLQLLAETVREERRESKTPRWLRRVRDWLQEEYDAPPTLRRLATEAGVHPTYLAACFQQHFGIGVGEFVQAMRIEEARTLLATDIPLAEVALRVGFADQSHFGRVFKRQTGLTPGEYRRLFTKK